LPARASLRESCTRCVPLHPPATTGASTAAQTTS
jgi:hypothetical protein